MSSVQVNNHLSVSHVRKVVCLMLVTLLAFLVAQHFFTSANAQVAVTDAQGTSLNQGDISLLESTNSGSPDKARFLEEMARLGRLYRTEDIQEFQIPSVDGTTRILSPRGYDPIGLYADEDSGALLGWKKRTLGVHFAEQENTATYVGSTGMGYKAGIDTDGLTRISGHCATIWFTPKYRSDADHRLGTCYEKWRVTGTNRWAYNRWAWFTRATPRVRYAEVIDFTIRSRPWRGFENRITGMTAHSRAVSTGDCSTTANVNLRVGGVGLSIPVHQCSHTEIRADFNRYRGGIDWDGRTTKQLNLDFGMALETNGSPPIMADYAWIEICVSHISWTCRANPSQTLASKDPGW